jgi:hypothetical protein
VDASRSGGCCAAIRLAVVGMIQSSNRAPARAGIMSPSHPAFGSSW